MTSNSPEAPRPNTDRKAMGRGLSSLIGGAAPAKNPPIQRVTSLQERVEAPVQNAGIVETQVAVEKVASGPYREIEISKIQPNPEQPRRHFNPEKIEELATSLKEQGLISPIVVREKSPEQFEIIAGERRWRAAQVAGLEKLPVILRDREKAGIANDLAAITENIQREDLNPVELALAYGRMIKNYQITQEDLAQRLGISRVKLANTLRLLKLPVDIREMLTQGRIQEGHARAMLALPNEEMIRDVAAQTAQFHLSVRDVETRVRNLITAHEHPDSHQAQKNGASTSVSGSPSESHQKSPQLQSMEEELRKIFGTKAAIVGKKAGGIIELYYTGEDSLNRLFHQLRLCQDKN